MNMKTRGHGSEQAVSTPTCLDAHFDSQVWKCYYAASPLDGVSKNRGFDLTNTSLFMGGEACIWGEGTNFLSIEEQTLTPASAVAERLWSGGSVERQHHQSQDEIEERLSDHVCLLNSMGLRASPIGTGFCLTSLQQYAVPIEIER